MIKEILYYFEGLDKSILKLNEYLIDSPFEFKLYTLDQFKEKFQKIIIENEDNDDTMMGPLGYSPAFAYALNDLIYFTQLQILRDRYIVFLRYSVFDENELPRIKIENKELKSDDSRIEINKEVKELIEKLKLIKPGHIKIISEFEFTDDLRCIPISHSYSSKNVNYEKYFFDDDDVIDFGLLKKSLVKPPAYLNLALESFFESYNIENGKLRFVMLMVCLESIFIMDKDKDKIGEILSKFSALIITSNKKKGDKKITRIKKILYDFRSRILHGNEENKTNNKIKEYNRRLQHINIYISALEEIVRAVLKELILDNKYSEIKSKKQLRKYLEPKGFQE